ncbi:hypothetical protein NQ317_010992 [Molorchus minor]|uniref:Biogenesis of lysosome-related organelles complex 1 subunit 5 n=1 Tax=Molorchus minor TaxID=1323400 RepID=A0ABQ9K367_9CUCU|nr:hypothetical protein NQ317_010992 [Molorchus minor]
MSDVIKDVGKVWDRLFDHKGFLSGEIGFMLREFELKRGDREVDNLFSVIENITDIKDTQVDCCKQAGDQTVLKANEALEQALNICHQFVDLEEKYKQDTTVEDNRSDRKLVWDCFMNRITTEYSEINGSLEAKEETLNKLYEEFEKKIISLIPYFYNDKLRKYINGVKVCDDMPYGISNIVFKNKVKKNVESKANIGLEPDIFTKCPLKTSDSKNSDKLLNLSDLHWLYGYIQKDNSQNDNKIYLHELLEGSEIILPKNKEIPRSEELEKRCRQLKAQQENQSYYKMTKHVDMSRKRLPEDSFGYQVKQMNKHLVAIFQFIVSVAAGFAFGFIGIELLIGSLDFGFRLLLGIICALTIALAELYFLAKRLNEDLQLEYTVEKQQKKC